MKDRVGPWHKGGALGIFSRNHEPASGPQSGPQSRPSANYVRSRGPTRGPGRPDAQNARGAATIEVVDCRGKTADELRRELFGEVRDGTPVAGALERARRGTAQLEHVDALPMDVQTALVATLGDHVFLHVGGCTPRRLRARVVGTLGPDHASPQNASKIHPRLLDLLGSISIHHEPVANTVPPQPAVLPEPSQTLVVGTDGRWMRPPDQPPRDLRRRKNLRRILAALTRQHQLAPQDGIALADLIEIGWPGERMSNDAATNRIYVALTTLRKFGLHGLLIRRGRCYLLDPKLTVQSSPMDWDAVALLAEPAN